MFHKKNHILSKIDRHSFLKNRAMLMAGGLLVVLALFLAACTSTAVPIATPTDIDLVTEEPLDTPTLAVVTEEPATNTPTSEVMEEPATETPTTEMMEEPATETPMMEEPTVEPTMEQTPEPMAEPAVITVVDSAFEPNELTVSVGTTVIWEQAGSLPHTVTADNGTFDSGTLNSGDTFEYTFDEAGTYPYYCEFHGGPGGVGMSGTIIVNQ